MQRFVICALILGSLLPLSACGIPGGIAYGVKAMQGSTSEAGSDSVPAARPAPSMAEPDPSPPPTPIRRESVQVEQLPPPN